MKRKKLLCTTASLALAFALCGCTDSLFGGEGDGRGKINIDSDTTENGKNNEGQLWDDKAVEDKISEINSYINNFYYFDIDRDKQEEALYDGIMEGLDDPYSVYYTEEEYKELMEDNSGEYVGIGTVVTTDEDGNIKVVRPVQGGPAEEAGILADDVIVEVDGTNVIGMDLSLAVDIMRGTEGTTSHIKVYREGEDDYLEFDIVRRVVENVTVSFEMLENNIGYVAVEQFYENTADEFEAAIEELQAQGAEGLVIDLRDNPGGLLTAVVDMCDYIMEDGTIVTTKDKNGRILEEYKAKDDHSLDLPMAVLTNGNSASASEIFSGAMKDTGKAELVGTTTYGKGIVQSVIPLTDGTAIKLTIAKYFTPNGNDIHTKGVEPDYEVELSDGRTNAVNIEYEEDLQLHKAEKVVLDIILDGRE